MLTHYFHLVVDYIGAHPTAAIFIVFLISMGEALFVIGLFVPSTIVLVGAGTLIGMGKLTFWPIYLAASLGAIAGDALSYWFGHVYKEHVRQFWPFSRYTSLLDRGETFFARHGGKSVFIGRFIPGVKAVVPGVAGIAGMDPLRFSAINVASALVWSASHLLPGMGLGRAVNVTTTADPRFLELAILVAILLIVVWYATKIAFFWLLPHLDQLRRRCIGFLTQSRAPGAVFLKRLLSNEEGVLTPFVLGSFAAAGLTGFVMIAYQMLFDPAFVRADSSISGYLQTLRTPLFDRAMVFMTMLGDASVLTPVALAGLAAILWNRRWRLAGAVASGFLAATLFVPAMKSVIQRTRPMDLYSGAESFSFPSGHATLSATIIGVLTLLAAHGFKARTRIRIYVAAALAIALIGFSRLYLRAHWPSDVAAGLLFGASLVFLLAWLLHGRVLGAVPRHVGIAVIVVMTAAYANHLRTDLPQVLASYAPRSKIKIIDQAAWLRDPARYAQGQRVLLDGAFGEPMVLQTDLPVGIIAKWLSSGGWTQGETSQMMNMVDAILPAKAAAGVNAPLPLTHQGRPPTALFVKSISQDAALVLRFWRTETEIGSERDASPLLVASITRQSANRLLFGYALPDAEVLDAAMETEQGDAVAGLLAQGGAAQRLDAKGWRIVTFRK